MEGTGYVGSGAALVSEPRRALAKLDKTQRRLISVSNGGVPMFSNDVSFCARPWLDGVSLLVIVNKVTEESTAQSKDLTSIYDAHMPLTLDLGRAPLKLSRVQESCCVDVSWS